MIKHVIYLPGIGDHHANIQIKLLNIFRLFGLKVHFAPIGWADNEAFELKLARIIKIIDSFDEPVGLIGVSAGGSAAVNAYLKRRDKVAKVVFICGKIKGVHSVGAGYYRKNPAFKDSLKMSSSQVGRLTSNDTDKMLCLSSPNDQVVPATDSQIRGAKNKLIKPPLGHIGSIAAGLTIYAPYIARFIRS